MHRTLVRFLLLWGLLAGFGQIIGLAQTPSIASASARNAVEPLDQNQVLRALLEEVRALRLALERSQYNSVLLQTTVEQLRMRQDMVNQLSQRLDDCRTELTSLQQGLTRLPDHVKEIERRMQNAEDAQQRTLLESELKATQLAHEEQKERSERQRVRADQLTTQLQDEQHKLDELYARLAHLEQQLPGREEKPVKPR